MFKWTLKKKNGSFNDYLQRKVARTLSFVFKSYKQQRVCCYPPLRYGWYRFVRKNFIENCDTTHSG
jgi:hypothetical protein